MNKKDALIARVVEMEQTYDYVLQLLKKEKKHHVFDSDIKNRTQILRNYQESGQWLRDYESDEMGDLPSDLKRGVLSEDGLYNLLKEVDECLSTECGMRERIMNKDKRRNE